MLARVPHLKSKAVFNVLTVEFPANINYYTNSLLLLFGAIIACATLNLIP